MKKNKGFSLIELLVVIALVAILATVVGMSVSAVFSSNASKCANNIGALASKCRFNSMARAGEVAMVIYTTDNGVYGEYWEGGSLVSTEKLGDGRMGISYTTSAGGTAIDVNASGNRIYISYARATGAMKTIGQSAAAADAAVADATYVDTIFVASGSKNIDIKFVQPTGKHTVAGS